jgi:hypothetical protein
MGNSMVSSAIEVFEKLTSVCLFQIARETILLLLINNMHEKIMQSPLKTLNVCFLYKKNVC